MFVSQWYGAAISLNCSGVGGSVNRDMARKRFLREAATHLAQGARRSLLFGEATDPEGPQARPACSC